MSNKEYINTYKRYKSLVVTLISNISTHENWWNGFLVGFFIGGVVGIFVLDLVQRGIL